MRGLAPTALLATALSLIATPLSTQQFVGQTATRFPAPNPTEYTNQLSIGDLDGDDDLDIGVADLTGNGAYDIVTAQGESGNFQNRIYINSGPADTFPPTILDTEQYTDADDVGPYALRAAILDQMTSDRNSFDSCVQLNYTVDAGPDQSVEMVHSGGQIYRGEIPGQPAGDHNDNMATGSTMNFVIPVCDLVNDYSGNGSCVGNQVCDCDSGWDGPDCSIVNLLGAGTISLTPGLSFRGTPGPGYRLTCSTNNQRFLNFTPDAGDLYFLVVPQTENSEGSYGLESDLQPRPVSGAACHGQSIICQ